MNKIFGEMKFDSSRGFLPVDNPLASLPVACEAWEAVALQLPKILMTDGVRKTIESLPPFDTSQLQTEAEIERAMLILSYIGHAYVWGEAKLTERLPANLAAAWHAIAKRLGRHPVLSYASYALHNWRRLDASREIECGNIALLQNFLGGADEEWFILIHVDIEAKAKPAIASLLPAQEAVTKNDAGELQKHLTVIAKSLQLMCATLDRMPEKCDPYIYYNRVRPYIFGWKNNPALPSGLIYEGVDEYAGKPQQFRGETGAQSSIIPSLDAALGIAHANDVLLEYLLEMREYMPRPHRAFIAQIEGGASIRNFVIKHRADAPALRDVYNECVSLVERFRRRHLEYAATYIHNQAQRAAANSNEIGTGGTPFMIYLAKHKDETAQHLI